MFKNILVPTDLTENSRKALDIAAKMATQNNPVTITLIHVVEIIENTEEEEFKDFYDRLKKRAESGMKELADQYRDENTYIEQVILFGKRVREIVKYAYENDIDLIILGSHRIDKVDNMQGWATISYRVGILSHCPVLMVK
jgi:nucleotide-binding universal stress UspA family protein